VTEGNQCIGEVFLGRFAMLLATGLLLLLSGCATRPVQMRLQDVDNLLAGKGGTVRIVDGQQFSLLTVVQEERATNGTVLRVYIEGDGLAWRTRRRLSAHPTPVNPLALRLMLADPFADKLYIARPCQYVQTEACDARFWSSDRYGAEIVAATNQVLEKAKRKYGYERIELVGYSGGATVALLVAAQRTDVISVRTVCGNLDTAAFSRLHRVSPLTGSLNPVDFSPSLQKIPQIHFIGEKDKRIPEEIFNSYRKFFSETGAMELHRVPDADHHHGWVEQWPRLVRQAIDTP
jgi:pimeloyl-ACP methyl ester carboxylesterase